MSNPRYKLDDLLELIGRKNQVFPRLFHLNTCGIRSKPLVECRAKRKLYVLVFDRTRFRRYTSVGGTLCDQPGRERVARNTPKQRLVDVWNAVLPDSLALSMRW